MLFNLVPPKTDMISYDLLQTHSSVYDWKMSILKLTQKR